MHSFLFVEEMEFFLLTCSSASVSVLVYPLEELRLIGVEVRLLHKESPKPVDVTLTKSHSMVGVDDQEFKETK